MSLLINASERGCSVINICVMRFKGCPKSDYSERTFRFKAKERNTEREMSTYPHLDLNVFGSFCFFFP